MLLLSLLPLPLRLPSALHRGCIHDVSLSPGQVCGLLDSSAPGSSSLRDFFAASLYPFGGREIWGDWLKWMDFELICLFCWLGCIMRLAEFDWLMMCCTVVKKVMCCGVTADVGNSATFFFSGMQCWHFLTPMTSSTKSESCSMTREPSNEWCDFNAFEKLQFVNKRRSNWW